MRVPLWYDCAMHEINDAIVENGKLTLTQLPFANGQHVRVIVTEAASPRRTINDVRELLRGGVVRFDDPFEPMIPADSWEMLK